MSKKKCGLILFLLLSLMACGQPGADDIPVHSQTDPNHSTYDWKTEDWRHSDDKYTGEMLYVEEYISGLEYQPEFEYDSSYSEYKCWGANIYSLNVFSTFTDSSSHRTCYINGYEDATGRIWHQRIELPELEEYGEAEKYIASFDIRKPQEYVLFVQILEEDKTQEYLAMHFSLEGELLGMVNLYPAMQTYGINLEGRQIFSNAYVDCEGRYFFSSFSGEEIVVLDSKGVPLTELTWDKEDLFSSYIMKTAEGEPVFEQHSNASQESRLVMYDPSTGGERAFQESLPSCGLIGITEDGVLYYGDQGQLYLWELYTGSAGVCFDYGTLGMGRNLQMTHLGFSCEGFPMILDHSREKAIICKLGPEPGKEGEPIRLVSLVKDSSFIASSAIMFSQEHMEHPILMQQAEGNLADFRTRAMADLTAGNGADIYYVSGEDMRTLYEKGVLADLSDVLGENLRKSLYEGALSCGAIDGHQVGLPLEAYVTTLLVSDELWPEDNWTLEEALNVMEEHPELKKIMTSRKYTAKSKALRLLLLQDLPNSPFLDMDSGICDFDNPLFIRALEMINNATGDNDPPSVMKDGKAAAYQPNLEGFADFSSEMSGLGEGFHPVGFPTEAESGSYWNADYFLVVNARAGNRELIDAYLAALYDWNRQRELSHPIRNDMVERNIIFMEDDPLGLPWKYSIGGGIYNGLDTKPDGSPWTEEYKDILDQAVPRPQNTYYIEDIILEEAASFLSGTKSAEQAAEIIQNRVQLYLNEQQ